MKIHLDTDIGGDIDDLCALALLLKAPDVALVGVTTVAEDRGRRAGYARYALRLAGREDIPVAAGADGARNCFRHPVAFPDEAAYWPEPIAPLPGDEAAALALLRRSVEAGATVVAIGPHTNLALADRTWPGLLDGVPLVLMGGSIRPAPPGFPAWDFREDWNIQEDVAAARHVFTRLRPTVVPIEVTAQTALRRAYIPALEAAGPLGQLLARQTRACAAEYGYEAKYGRARAGLPDDTINFQHDALACAVALGWDGVVVEELPLAVAERDGWLRLREQSGGRPLPVVTAADGARFNAHWLDVVSG